MKLPVTILTGQSGSGKSTALHALEDRGFLCVDNLPPGMIEELITNARDAPTVEHVAVVIDVRARGLRNVPGVVRRLRQGPDPVRVVYFEARRETLLRRYSETRRPHPLDRGEGLHCSLDREMELLLPLRELADEIIDTSALSPHELRAQVVSQLVEPNADDSMRLALVSFGFKYGLPLDAAMVLDVRFLPNPHFVSELKAFTGLDERVRDYVLTSDEGRSFLDRTTDYLSYLLPHFRQEGKRYLTVAVGCTGGRHRSVAVVYELARRLANQGIVAAMRHRDVNEGAASGEGSVGGVKNDDLDAATGSGTR